jgi:hypothetical protein
MTNVEIILCGIISLLIAGFAAYLFWAQKKFTELENLQLKAGEAARMQLAAYERLSLFAERIKLENLTARLFTGIEDAGAMRKKMVQAIQEEFEYNSAQQIYVKPEIWHAVNRMKDQNIFIINQVAASLPAQAGASEYNRQLLLLIGQGENTTMNKLVLQAIQNEAQSLLHQ